MPNNLFGRIARILIFPTGRPTIVIGDDLRFEFTCKKIPSSDPNTAEVKITNLSKITRRTLDDQIDTPLILSAGYSEGEGLVNVFFGNIMSVKHDTTPPNIITTIEVGDGAESLRDSKVSLSFKKNTLVSTVVQQLAIGFGKPIKNPEAITSIEGAYLSGYCGIGNNKTLMDQLARDNGFSWSIQDDEIVFINNGDIPPVDILVLSPETGMVGSPKRNTSSIDKQETTVSVDNRKPAGWDVAAKLFPEVVPGGFIALRFAERPLGEIVKVVEVEHSGDTYGNTWTTKLQVQDI